MYQILTELGQPILTESNLALLTDGIFPIQMPLQKTIPSYLYQEYADDQDLQAFVASQNAIMQSYLDWFNQTPLGVYTSPNINGPLLDWIGQGLYGIERPVFSSLVTGRIAGLNAYALNTLALNGAKRTQSGTAVLATDDFYKRTITWHVYAGNGFQFTVPLLRLLVARFIYGANGTDVTLSQAQAIHIASGPLASPPIPSLTSMPGGSITTQSIAVQLTGVNQYGETLAGPGAGIVISANNLMVVNSFAATPGLTGYNVYAAPLPTPPARLRAGLNTIPVNTRAVDGTNKKPGLPLTKQNATPIPIGTAWTEPTSGLITGTALPTTNTSNTQGNFIITVPAAAGAASQFFQQAFQQGELAFPFQLTASVVIA